MRTPLILVGASGLAREALEVVLALGDHDVIGIVDDDRRTHGSSLNGVPVLGGIEVVAKNEHAQVVVCVGRGATREELVRRLDLPINRYATLVHPAATTGRSCVIERGSIVLAGSVLTASVRLARHVVVMPNVTLTHDDDVADFATLCAGVTLGGNVVVDEAAYLGMNASVREGCTIGRHAVIGMGAVVVSDVPTRQVWAGCPARPMGTRSIRVAR